MGLCPKCYYNELNVNTSKIYKEKEDEVSLFTGKSVDKIQYGMYLTCKRCGWQGKYSETATQEEAINKRRTDIIDKILE